MILTVTPAPAIDWTISLDSFAFADVNRASASIREPSGKGINVSVALHRAGCRTTAIFPSGGTSGDFLTAALSSMGVPVEPIASGADVRTNITLRLPERAGTKINEPAHPVDPRIGDELLAAVDRWALQARAVVSSGTLPAGLDDDFHLRVVERAHKAGIQVVVDAEGTPFTTALPAHPDLVKPNVHELAAATGRRISTLHDVVSAAQELRRVGARAVLASLGGDGAVYVDSSGSWAASAKDIPVVNAVGAGDALLAGFLRPEHATSPERLANAVLWASSAVASSATLFTVNETFAERVQVTAVPANDARLSEPSAPLAATP